MPLDPNRGLPSPDFLTNPLPKSLIRPWTVCPIVRDGGANASVLMSDVPRKLSQRVLGEPDPLSQRVWGEPDPQTFVMDC